MLVGVTGHKDLTFEPLPSGKYDVEELERTLDSHRNGEKNFEVSPFVVDEDSTWGAGELLDVIDRELDACDHFLFYFSGHGVLNEYGLQLVTPEKEHPLDSGVYFDTLLHRFNAATTTEVTVILDCCYSGAAGDGTLALQAALRPITQLRDGITILASSGRDELSFTGDAAAPSEFTQQVIDCLDRVDTQSTNVLELYLWARERLENQTPVLRTFGSDHSALRAADAASSVRS